MSIEKNNLEAIGNNKIQSFVNKLKEILKKVLDAILYIV